MSRIDELKERIEVGRSTRIKNEEFMAIQEHEENKKTTITTRFDPYHLFVLDFMANNVSSSRSSMMNNIVIAGLFDLIEKMELTEKIEAAYVEHIKKGAAENV
jgi:hypothetical protein